jgi:hypothetical protein
MNTNRWKIEHSLYALAVLLALGVRLARLGAFPLSNFEAGWALQALSLSIGREPAAQVTLGANPGYWLITSLLFSVIGDSNFVARLWPALTGAALVLLPLFFRRRLGAPAALLMAFGLALDPGLVAVSRTAGEGMPAVALGLLALGAAYRCKPALAGLLGGLALLGGSQVLVGAVGLGLAYGAMRLLDRAGWLAPEGGEIDETPDQGDNASLVRTGLYFAAATVLIAGTLFFRHPRGLSALASTLVEYLNGWTVASGVPALRLLVVLVVYQPLGVLLAVVSTTRGAFLGGARARLAQLLSLWALASLLLVLLYPSRQVSDLVWVLVPVWGLAAIEIERYLSLPEGPLTTLVTVSQAAFLCIIMALIWLYFLALVRSPASVWISAAVIAGAIGLGGLTTFLISSGWSWEAGRRGLAWSAFIMLGLFTLSRLWGANLVRPGAVELLWYRTPAYGENDLLMKTMSDLSDWTKGFKDVLDAVVLVESPSLHWELRDWKNVRYTTELDVTRRPSVFITYQDQETPSLDAIYRGQDFVWEIYPGWQGVMPADLPRWLAYNEAPTAVIQVILWARADLFPGGNIDLQGELPPGLEEELSP